MGAAGWSFLVGLTRILSKVLKAKVKVVESLESGQRIVKEMFASGPLDVCSCLQ